MKLPVTLNGQVLTTLYKHDRDMAKVAAGTMTLDQLKLRPWYMRVRRAGQSALITTLPHNDKQALSDALQQFKGRERKPEAFADFVAERAAKQSVTVGTLATEWIAEGCKRTGVKTRTAAQTERMEATMTRALPFWTTKPWGTITPIVMEDFVRHVQKNVREGTRFTGLRTVDIQLNALSCLGDWAMLTGKVKANPFATRPRFCEAGQVKHCHERMPENDEELHKVLAWLFTNKNDQATIGNRHRAEDVDRNQRIVGGWLAFQVLTGLRPGEPATIERLPEAAEFPGRNTRPGVVYPMPDGTKRIRVARLKAGQNPGAPVTPALAGFLRAWNAWMDTNLPDAKLLFPVRADLVHQYLERACVACGLPIWKPHGLRAYYARVRRSQGMDNLEIAVELGQTSKGQLIRDIYGDADDDVGGNRYDWLPKTGATAWELLATTMAETKMLPVNFNTTATENERRA